MRSEGTAAAQPVESFDLLIRNGHVLDPGADLDQTLDIGIRHGRIAAIGPALDATSCPDIRDAAGTFVSPGLIDLHGHWYEAGLYGINADIGLNYGVTTAVDAGTAGFANFPNFRRSGIEPSRTRILAFVHLSFMGLHAPFAEELLDMRYARPIETGMVIEQHRDVAVGVKVRIGSMTGTQGDQALDLALQAAREARVPLMVHISAGANERCILERLRPGDILTHCFHGRGNGLRSGDTEGFIPQVQRARDHGVIFDIGHGCGSFSWETAQRGFEHHFWPDTISTDLHRYSVAEPWAVTMPNVMSKFLCLGMSLNDVIRKTTIAPAQAVDRSGELGSLKVGGVADLFQFRLREGSFEFRDADQRVRKGDRLIEPIMTVRSGKVYLSGDVRVELRQIYPCDILVFGEPVTSQKA
jgi:dihydroorotase